MIKQKTPVQLGLGDMMTRRVFKFVKHQIFCFSVYTCMRPSEQKNTFLCDFYNRAIKYFDQLFTHYESIYPLSLPLILSLEAWSQVHPGQVASGSQGWHIETGNHSHSQSPWGKLGHQLTCSSLVSRRKPEYPYVTCKEKGPSQPKPHYELHFHRVAYIMRSGRFQTTYTL